MAQLIQNSGQVEVMRIGAGSWRPVVPSMTFNHGDKIRAGPKSTGKIELSPNNVIKINPYTTIQIQPLDPKSSPPPESSWRIRIPQGAAAIRG